MSPAIRILVVTSLSATLVLGAGCQTPGPNGSTDNTAPGALIGGALGALAGGVIGNATHNSGKGALIGALAGAIAGGLVGHSTDQAQREWLRAHAPKTLEKVEHNNSVVQQTAPGPQPYSLSPISQAAPTAAPLTASDVKALSDAGVNRDVIASHEHAAPIVAQPATLNVDDVTALYQSGMKDEALIAEVGKSKARFTQDDIAAMQRSGVSPTVIVYIRKYAAS